ncbi:hypothetical protein PIROE2DRAFT_1491 [Piromyces sp. E2]|nr:hypothetical protein PIROE2DRAFT_1491 [Piromyces sp. E2]|eukprot:OUM70353.1 hypothetical protein PIROE2DRAFT_1491 [Piromyces sp. E2]
MVMSYLRTAVLQCGNPTQHYPCCSDERIKNTKDALQIEENFKIIQILPDGLDMDPKPKPITINTKINITTNEFIKTLTRITQNKPNNFPNNKMTTTTTTTTTTSSSS